MDLQICLQFADGDRATEPALAPARIHTLHYHGSILLAKVAIEGATRIGISAAGEKLPVTRSIEFNPNGSRHKCNAACRHARGRQCECSCGGRNHGIHR